MVNEFVKGLTLEDKVKLVHGDGSWHTHAVGALPAIMMTDGPHGLRKQDDRNKGINDSVKATCFPTACAVASSWNRRNAERIASAIADEAISENVSVVLGPGVNIKRSPLCGRNFEYFSEDPYLAGELASSYVSAMQLKGVGCSVKHFAVNSQETRRMTVNAVVDERALREIYLAAFEKVVRQSRPYTVMASYNKINGQSATQNKYLLTDILRHEWGFDGLVMSDWGASYDMGKSISAGMDLEMPDGGSYHEQKTLRAVENGELKIDDLDRACRNVAKLVERTAVKSQIDTDAEERHAICKDVAVDSAVLLKNDGMLPLSTDGEILVVGELAAKPRFQGAGSSHINATCKSFLEVMRDNNVKYVYAQGYEVSGDKINEKLAKQAEALASKYSTILFFGGLTDDFEGEGYDRVKLDIPNCQQNLLARLRAVNGNIAFVMFGGSPVVMPWLGNVKALLNMYLGGEAVCEAAYDLLFGKASPSGRLAETYPLKLEDTPCFKYFANDYFADEHRESIFVGYRYYNSFDVPTLFPFGYGLSYSSFTYSNLRVVSGEIVTVTVTVTNAGQVAASEVVQLYVDNCHCPLMRAKRELRGFDKVFLDAGQSVDVSFILDDRAFSVFIDGSFVKVGGKYTIAICRNVNETALSQEIEIDGQDVTGNDRELYPDYFTKRGGVFSVDEAQFLRLANVKKEDICIPKRGEYTLLNTFEDMRDSVGLIRVLMRFVKRMAKKSSPSKSADDPVAQMIYQGALTTPLISLMSMAGLPAKYVMFLYYHANKRHSKALKALFGKYEIL